MSFDPERVRGEFPILSRKIGDRGASIPSRMKRQNSMKMHGKKSQGS